LNEAETVAQDDAGNAWVHVELVRDDEDSYHENEKVADGVHPNGEPALIGEGEKVRAVHVV
jgi:hypothetical protein